MPVSNPNVFNHIKQTKSIAIFIFTYIKSCKFHLTTKEGMTLGFAVDDLEPKIICQRTTWKNNIYEF